jgi:hypothetical protein
MTRSEHGACIAAIEDVCVISYSIASLALASSDGGRPSTLAALRLIRMQLPCATFPVQNSGNIRTTDSDPADGECVAAKIHRSNHRIGTTGPNAVGVLPKVFAFDFGGESLFRFSPVPFLSVGKIDVDGDRKTTDYAVD